jgi:iron complex transport system substrate-binding protein
MSSRRPILRFGLASILAVSLVACGSDDDTSEPGATTADSSAASTVVADGTTPDDGTTTADDGDATESDTRVVQDVFGDVEVPVDPQRVVFMDFTGLGNALALGLPMDEIAGVAFDEVRDGNDYLQEEFGSFDGLADIGGGIYGSMNLEAITAADPDLIVFLALEDDEYSAEAKATLEGTGIPTFGAFNGYQDLDESMRLLADVGVALNLEDKAAELEAGYRASVEETIAGLPDVKPSMNAVRVFAPNDLWIQAHWLMDDIGLPRTAPPPPDLFLDISEEQLQEADADILFVSGDAGPEASLAAVESNPLWPDMTAVQNDHVIVVEDQPWGTDYSYPALVIILDTIADALDQFAADTGGG